jgi:hypothetical protein
MATGWIGTMNGGSAVMDDVVGAVCRDGRLTSASPKIWESSSARAAAYAKALLRRLKFSSFDRDTTSSIIISAPSILIAESGSRIAPAN